MGTAVATVMSHIGAMSAGDKAVPALVIQHRPLYQIITTHFCELQVFSAIAINSSPGNRGVLMPCPGINA